MPTSTAACHRFKQPPRKTRTATRTVSSILAFCAARGMLMSQPS
jgi:hypothetical protein